ncbi:MAG: DUF6825 family protein [Microcystaceae cyanobacterium]
MNDPNPILQAFFLGRAFAEVLNEKVEDTVTNFLSDLGKFDAEQRENLNQFMNEVQARAAQQANQGGVAVQAEESEDLQEMIDELRAEIAHLKTELKNYRN